MTHVIGIDLGGTTVKGGLVARDRGVVAEAVKETEASSGPEHIIDRVALVVRELLEKAPGRSVAGIGIGSPGAVNLERTTITRPPQFPGWEVINLAEAVTRRIENCPVVLVDNDAGAAAIGSSYFGAGRDFPSFIMITLGTGVGGGIIYEKRLFRGTTGGAAEIGHVSIDYEGPVARSGVAGAIEAYLGHNFLTHHARMKLLTRPQSVLHEMTGPELEGLTTRMIHEAAVQGDALAIEILAWAGHKLGCALGSVVNVLDIRKVVVGGGISAAGDFILGPARETLPRFVLPALHEGLEIVQETLGNEVGLLGAASLIFEHFDAYAPVAGRT
jgi:glucokinase